MKSVVLVSGGLDSAVCLAMAVDKYGAQNVIALNMFYGQKHEKEQQCAEYLCKHYSVKLINADLSSCFNFSNCPLLQGNGELDHRDYAEQVEETNGERAVASYVPFRNGLFLSYAAAIAYSFGADTVYYGAHADDAAGSAYPDCSAEFKDTMSKAIYLGTGNSVRVEAPFVECNKAGIVKKGLELGVPFEHTWSCYEGHVKACGTCGTCRDRQRAFIANDMEDPIEYEERLVWGQTFDPNC